MLALALAGSLKAAVTKAITFKSKEDVRLVIQKQDSELNHRIRVITASVRTTNRINALLNESIQTQKFYKKPILKLGKDHSDESTDDIEIQRPQQNFEYFRNSFTMDHVYNLIDIIIEDRLRWDRYNRMYDPWKSVQLAESLAKEIKEAVKTLNHDRYRIVCLTSVIEKQYQGTNWQMNFLMDEKLDNFTTHIHERATYNIVTVVFLVYKE